MVPQNKFDLQSNVMVYYLYAECGIVEIEQTLNEILVKLFRNINAIEEQAIRTEEYKNVTTNDMHVIEAIGIGSPKNMTAVAKELGVTTGTLTISVNSLVKKGLADRVRSEEDRRVVLVSLSRKGIKAYEHHHRFHEEMIGAVVERLTDGEKAVLEKALKNLNRFFRDKAAE
jgi:DNA-binding MarR family transcriptional regulator